jgi:transposase
MRKNIMLGIDLHDATLVIKMATGREAPETLRVENAAAGRRTLWTLLRERATGAGRSRVVMAYEASCQGFSLRDEACAEGFECHVLAPTKIAVSGSHRRRKNDERDAERLLEVVRGHVLAGNERPSVWVPGLQTREDREIVRGRLDVAEKTTRVKAQIRTLLKRNAVRPGERLGRSWTARFEAWLRGLTKPTSALPHGARVALTTLLRQKAALDGEIAFLDAQIEALAGQARYAEPARALDEEKGVGPLTAMVFLTEMGDLSRFKNRKQVGAYLGLVPSSHDSGETPDRKGHITHQGPGRVRRVLCQASWSRSRTDPKEKAAYERIVRKNPRHKKIAVVAMMRRLGVQLWRLGAQAQRRHGCFAPEAA